MVYHRVFQLFCLALPLNPGALALLPGPHHQILRQQEVIEHGNHPVPSRPVSLAGRVFQRGAEMASPQSSLQNDFQAARYDARSLAAEP